jgi:hypothetical protein
MHLPPYVRGETFFRTDVAVVMSFVSPFRRRLLVAILILVPLGVGTKFYAGPGAGWVQAHAGGVLYVVFWSAVVLGLWPRLSPWTAAGAVLVATSILEGLQLWKPPVLEAVRDTFVGHAVLGSTFSWADLPHYVVGAGLGGGLGQVLRPDDAGRTNDQGPGQRS